MTFPESLKKIVSEKDWNSWSQEQQEYMTLLQKLNFWNKKRFLCLK